MLCSCYGPSGTDAARHLDSSISHSYSVSLALGHGGFLASVWDSQGRAPIGPSRSADYDQPGRGPLLGEGLQRDCHRATSMVETIFTDWRYYPHFTEEEVEAQGGNNLHHMAGSRG